MQTFLVSARRAIISPGGLVLLALCLRLVVLASTSGLDYDITSYHIQAQSVFAHQNIYLLTNRYPYPPVWIWLVTLAQAGANITALPFVWFVKVPGLLGDILIVVLLRRYQGVGAALFYALNPVAILVTGGQGQFDGLVMALVVLAWVCWRSRQAAGPYWAALALGGAIALKAYPVLLLPALLACMSSARQRLIATTLACLPVLAAMAVYSALFGLSGSMISRILVYNSPLNFGWALYIPFLMNALWPAGFALVMLTLALVTRAAIILLACLLPLRRPDWTLERCWLVILLGFYVLAPGVSAQYLLWALPFLALVDLRMGWRYTALSALVMWLFYVAVYPGSVPWGPTLRSLAPSTWFLCFVVVNLFWWIACLLFWRQSLRRGSVSTGLKDQLTGIAGETVKQAIIGRIAPIG